MSYFFINSSSKVILNQVTYKCKK